MKGKKQFSLSDEKEIKGLLSKKEKQSREEQKITLNHLRKKFDFYISDFTTSKNGFSVKDFDFLKKSGQILIR